MRLRSSTATAVRTSAFRSAPVRRAGTSPPTLSPLASTGARSPTRRSRPSPWTTLTRPPSRARRSSSADGSPASPHNPPENGSEMSHGFGLRCDAEEHRTRTEVASMATIPNSSRWVRIAVVAVVAVLASTAGVSAATPRPPRWVLHGKYAPAIDPADFVAAVDNRYLPFRPGAAFHFRGVKDGTRQTDNMVVTRQVKRVLGIRCTVVRDTVSEHGTAVERTFDWYAQDKRGNVWYMGEDSLD